jgi:hypothetical protein
LDGAGLTDQVAVLNDQVVAGIIPNGAVVEQGQWMVSYGFKEEHCAVGMLGHAELTASLRLVRRTLRAWLSDRRHLRGTTATALWNRLRGWVRRSD